MVVAALNVLMDSFFLSCLDVWTFGCLPLAW